jgi:hypothetical protein
VLLIGDESGDSSARRAKGFIRVVTWLVRFTVGINLVVTKKMDLGKIREAKRYELGQLRRRSFAKDGNIIGYKKVENLFICQANADVLLEGPDASEES